MIQVDHLTRTYDNFVAVDDVSFSISHGEVVGLLGHNGAGKTTIMKMITGFLEPTSGQITIDGNDIGRSRKKIQSMIGYLPENCPVYPEMHVADYLDYAASLHGIKAGKRPALIAKVLQQTGLVEKALQPISTLSRGYRQRTGVAQAILHKPKIIILDEPTNGLDPTQIQHMRALIKELAQEATVIISTHILQEVQAVCDRVIIMKDGQKALDANLDELQSKQKLLVESSGETTEFSQLLNDLPGIDSIEPCATQPDKGIAHIVSLKEGADQHALASQIAQKVTDNHWQLYQMHFETRTLETVFAEISAR
ncbi:ABC transporter ATP-binding protein [Desulfogranum japonicum]|uniref:ABC transporter ATP-binding protein n=1 Tax=Desulfogranum japonicum TaxID=231447 RepID=UPI00041F20D5|nr:ATP-binding cassette domain-containing protein [Desulfogranum japonicum]